MKQLSIFTCICICSPVMRFIPSCCNFLSSPVGPAATAGICLPPTAELWLQVHSSGGLWPPVLPRRRQQRQRLESVHSRRNPTTISVCTGKDQGRVGNWLAHREHTFCIRKTSAVFHIICRLKLNGRKRCAKFAWGPCTILERVFLANSWIFFLPYCHIK